MKKRIVAVCLLLSGFMLTGYLVAGQSVENTIKQSLSKIFPPEQIDSIGPSQLDGISEVLVGMNIFYVTNDGKYVLQGKLIELESRTDLTETRLSMLRLQSVANIGEDTMIVFPAREQRHVITVFTDIDCGYCRKLHNEVKKYNDLGITVRYLSFPRTGPETPSYYKAVSVWCADDRNAALTNAKAGEELPEKKCQNPVKDHFDLGVAMGVRGTPAILMENGTILPGYVPAKKLVKELDSMLAGRF